MCFKENKSINDNNNHHHYKRKRRAGHIAINVAGFALFGPIYLLIKKPHDCCSIRAKRQKTQIPDPIEKLNPVVSISPITSPPEYSRY